MFLFSKAVIKSFVWLEFCLVKHLFGDLAKVVDEADGGRLFQRVVNVVDVHLALIEEMVEHVYSLHRWRALLLVAEYEVNPFMQVGTDIVAL